MKIIPAIDLINGKCVRLTKGDYATEKIYNDDPLEVAKQFEGIGIQYLHLVDLDGAKKGEPVNLKVLENLASNTNLSIDFGGGIRASNHVKSAFNAGAKQINLGSITVKNPELVQQWLTDFEKQAIIFSADVKGRQISTHGWLNDDGPQVSDYFNEWIKLGGSFFTSTQIEQDGTLEGADVSLYNELTNEFPNVHVIASGGIGSVKDVEEVAKTGVYGCIIGKAIYEGIISLPDLQKLNEDVKA